MSDEANPQSSQSNESIFSGNQQACYLLKETIDGRANAAVEKRNDNFIKRLIRIIAVIVSLFSVIAIVVAVFIAYMLNYSLRSAVYENVNIQINEALPDAVADAVKREVPAAVATAVAAAVPAAVPSAVAAAVPAAVAAAVEGEVAAAVEEAVAAAMPAAVERAAAAVVSAAVEEAVAAAVEGEVAAAAQATADAAAEKVVSTYQFDSDVAALNLRIQNIDRSESFSSIEAEEIISQINSLVSRADEQEFRKLEFALDTVVKNFGAADRLDLVIQLEDIAPNWYRSSDIVVQTMVQAFGFKLLGDVQGASSWTDTTGSKFKIFEDYRTYANRAELSGYPELPLLYGMLLSYVEDPLSEVIGDLIKDADRLDEVDAEFFVTVMAALANEEVTKISTPESTRVASRVTNFLCDYNDKGRLLGEVSRQTALECND